MKRFIIKNKLIIIFFATLICILVSLLVSFTNINVANAESISMSGHSGYAGRGVVGGVVKYRMASSSSGLSSDKNLIATLQNEKPGFKCKDGIAWGAYFERDTDSFLALYTNPVVIRANPARNNWPNGKGRTDLWDKYINDATGNNNQVYADYSDQNDNWGIHTDFKDAMQNPTYGKVDWLAGCYMEPAASGLLPDIEVTNHNFTAYTSRIRINSEELSPCPYEYTMQTVGVDGYVKNYTTAQHTYKTAYGKFLDDVASGKYNGSYYYVGNGKNADFSNSPQGYKNNDLINDYHIACQKALDEVDNYNIESEEKPDKTGSTVISGKEFLQRYAKGGIYKVIRGRKDGIINYKTTDVTYWKTTGSYDTYKFKGWKKCTNKDDSVTLPTGVVVKCSEHWSEDGTPETPSDLFSIINTNYRHDGWTKLDWQWNYDSNTGLSSPPRAAEDEYSSIISSGKNDVFLYDSGYYDAKGILHEKDDRKAETSEDWKNYFYEFVYGFEGNDISSELHPVKQEYNSWIHIWHQDFMNILCDKNDFNNYKTALSDMYGTDIPDIYTDISKVSDGSKYQGQLKSPIIDSEFISKYNVSDTWEPFDRVLYTVSTPITGNKLDMANAFTNIKSVVGDTSAATLLTKAKSVNSAYNTDNFIRWYNSAAYDASLDPVYTKECPYDCTDDAGGTASSSNDNVVNGRTEDGASPSAIGLKKKSDDRATGGDNDNDYGVRVRTTDSKGNLKDPTEDVNTANMTFFRNNTWNRFRVDIWYPIFKDGLTAASASDSIRGISETKGSQTAKSTTIIRNNGTPWYIKGTDSGSGFATEMKVIKSLDNGDSIDGSNARLFNPEINKITPGNQISLDSVTARGANVVELPYEATAFAIRSMWATDPNIGKLEFNIKWEFDSKNNLDVPTKFTVGNTADSVSSTSTPQYAISDGKCYGNQNKGQSYDYDLINLFHDNTGAGTIDNLDKEFNDNFGKFTIQFVRSTAE